MQYIASGSRSLSLLCQLNLDRVMFPAAIGGCLFLGGLILSL
ncbi:hypothetical protein PARPLA_01978 [Rhodobacteraceae bacterium THAF1]|nr:hypothetical protein [Palleronia sp. THAF1]QFU08887.1 hypothetical protein FIU81_09405 [Palleronia sp. THAF1]VDC24401.1 hypothetical protein PARPLA_01978 [Rhodobacteraceae bacterium THAF1]